MRGEQISRKSRALRHFARLTAISTPPTALLRFAQNIAITSYAWEFVQSHSKLVLWRV